MLVSGKAFAPVFYLAQRPPLQESVGLPSVTALTEGLHVIYLHECPGALLRINSSNKNSRVQNKPPALPPAVPL